MSGPQSTAKVGADFSGLLNEAAKATKALVDLGAKITGIATAAKAFDVATAAIGGTVNALGKIGLAAQGIEAIGKSAAGMGMGLLSGNAALEMTTISFKTLLGSASAANQEIQDLTKFAAATPFDLPGLEASTQKLLAFGFTSKDIIPLMTSMGDAIAALGGTQQNLDSLVYVMGQMHSEAHINAGDIMQMTNQGIPALQMLADHFKVTTGQMQEMISKGLVPGKEAVDIFSKGMEEKYGGMMAAQSATFSGMISNLHDWVTATTITLTKPFFEPAKKALAAFLAYVQSPAGTAAINKLAAMIQSGVDRMTATFIRLEPQFKMFRSVFMAAFQGQEVDGVRGFDTLLGQIATKLGMLANAVEHANVPIKVFLAAFNGQEVDGIRGFDSLSGQLATRLGMLAKTFEPLALSILKVTSALNPLSIAFTLIRGYLEGGVNGALDAVKTRFEQIAGIVEKGLAGAVAAIKKYGPQFINWVTPIAEQLLARLGSLASKVLTWVEKQAPMLLDKLKSLGYQLY
jgi:tape measure domain-containing protein